MSNRKNRKRRPEPVAYARGATWQDVMSGKPVTVAEVRKQQKRKRKPAPYMRLVKCRGCNATDRIGKHEFLRAVECRRILLRRMAVPALCCEVREQAQNRHSGMAQTRKGRSVIRQSDVPPDVWQKLKAAAGMPTRAKRKPPDVRTKSRGGWSITLTLAVKVVSSANRRDHWTVARRRKEVQCEALIRAIAGAGLSEHTPPLPVLVTWVRIGRELQDDDNLANSFKGLRDALAKWLQVDDGDTERVSWAYRQESGEPGVVVRVENRTQEGVK